jgi:hypothetical protein
MKQASLMQQGRLWQSALKPQGGLVNKRNKGVMRASCASRQYSSCDDKHCRKGVNCRNACATNTNCNVLPTSTEVKGHMLNATTATIVTNSMADESSTSSAMIAVAATTSATTKRVFPSVRTRVSSSATYTASTPITCTTSAALIRATKHTNYNNKHKQQQKTQPP